MTVEAKHDLERLADELAALVAKRLDGQIGTPEPSPWMCMADAITYTGVPAGTFRKWVAEGRIPSHGGRRRLFHRAELDAAGRDPGPARPDTPRLGRERAWSERRGGQAD